MTVRPLALSATLASLAACTAGNYAPSPPTPYEQQRLATAIGNRLPGPPQRCISAYPGIQVDAIGDKVVAKWGGRLWVNQVQGSCRLATGAGAFLVTEADPAGQYCDNQIWKVASSNGGMLMGSCLLGPWVEYRR